MNKFNLVEPLAFYRIKRKLSWNFLKSVCNWLNLSLNSCYIDSKATIGKNLYLEHGFGICIGRAKIGDNCMVGHGVTIGARARTDLGCPVIGDNVTIYCDSVVVGDIRVGNNVTIGAGTFVNRDIPDNTLVYNKKEMIMRVV